MDPSQEEEPDPVRVRPQIDVINDLMLLTAKPVTYLVNLSERDYIRKKNKWLPKIKAWIDENAPGDLLIPFSVALEERLAMEFADDAAGLKGELEKIGTQSQIGKIMKIGYQSLNVRRLSLSFSGSVHSSDAGTDSLSPSIPLPLTSSSTCSSSTTSRAALTRSAHGPSARASPHPRRPASSSASSLPLLVLFLAAQLAHPALVRSQHRL